MNLRNSLIIIVRYMMAQKSDEVRKSYSGAPKVFEMSNNLLDNSPVMKLTSLRGRNKVLRD